MKERIKELRKALNLSMEEFGARIGVTRSAISRIESGVVNVTNQIVTAVCREYNVSEIWLRDGVGSMFNELTRQQQAAYLVGKAFGSDDEFLINAFSALAELPPEELAVIKQFIKALNKTEK